MQRNRPILDVVQTMAAPKEREEEELPVNRDALARAVEETETKVVEETGTRAVEETETKVVEEEALQVNAQVVSRVVRPEDVETIAATDDGFIATLAPMRFQASAKRETLRTMTNTLRFDV